MSRAYSNATLLGGSCCDIQLPPYKIAQPYRNRRQFKKLKTWGDRGRIKLWEDTHSNLTFKYPLSAHRGRVSIIGPTAARIGQVLKHAIWGFVSPLTVEKGQIASYGVFLYQNNCLSESLQQRAFAAGEVFRGRTSAQTQKQPLLFPSMPSWVKAPFRERTRVSSTGQTRRSAKTATCVAKTSRLFPFLSLRKQQGDGWTTSGRSF